ncbi:MAG TPA: UDP-N-acetylenolpyruvoylglucosamine reductase [Phycisphaerales bacterium]|nr:UDP-N-acetylenolpyruvoylglucosamine reductase [Phycisphaerales bacterium]|tara:strand:+ start:25864 stop:26916 length:1053 start_codon:yes stop_codon:yes gene_type:complete
MQISKQQVKFDTVLSRCDNMKYDVLTTDSAGTDTSLATAEDGTCSMTASQILTELGIDHQTDVPLAPLTWYGVGGHAECLAKPTDEAQLASLMQKCAQYQIPVRILGSGANLLVSDAGVRGVVVRLEHPNFSQINIDGTKVTVGAGYDLAKLVLDTAREGLAGLEVLAGIPASVGGAVRMNAGGKFGEIGPVVTKVRVMDESGEIYERYRDDLVFGYRKSNIKALVILDVEFDLSEDDPNQLMKQVKEIFMYKKNTQPLADDSAGCAFKNPLKNENDANPYLDYSAGKLIDMAELKGYTIGGASISQRHANFVVAGDNCTATDIINLLNHITQTVLEKYGVRLKHEIVIW